MHLLSCNARRKQDIIHLELFAESFVWIYLLWQTYISLNTLVTQQFVKYLFTLEREDTFNKCTNWKKEDIVAGFRVQLLLGSYVLE